MDFDSYGKEYILSRVDLAKRCEELRNQCSLLISFGDNSESLKLFESWNIHRVPIVRPSSNTKRQTELIITNYEIPFSEMLDDEEWELVA